MPAAVPRTREPEAKHALSWFPLPSPFSSTPSPGGIQVPWRSGVFVYLILLGEMFVSFLLTISLTGFPSSPFSFLSRQALLFNFLKKYLLLLLKIRAFFDSLGVRQLGFLSEKGLVRLQLWQEKAEWSMCGICFCPEKGLPGRKQVPRLLLLASRLLPPLT